jgi:riboflavin synthase alpha subunit
MNKVIREYFKKHREFSKVWEAVKLHKLVNFSVLNFLQTIFDKKSSLVTFVVSTPSTVSELMLHKYSISIDGTELMLICSKSGNSLTFNLKHVIHDPTNIFTIKMKNNTEIRIY